ncbi:methylaspartate mutase [Nonomuraea sp. B10E15]|uniref:methylaspartate mutase n=1 Tax=unclassified Nonomuraea TaxID=2593643 RepID=UPI00325F9243
MVRSLFTEFVALVRKTGTLIVQPRMGFDDPALMRRGLLAVRSAGVTAIGTVTLDSYTRQGEHDRAEMAVESGLRLNGYPLVAHGAETTARMLDGVIGAGFPVQVRHGSPFPEQIFRAMLDAGVDASEGGPVSYCLPYSRMPLRESAVAWSKAARLLAEQRERGVSCHLESFGGCMLGQLCPPSLLVALSVLECLFFQEHGVPSVSASYAQQTHQRQDAQALTALRRLCAEHLTGVDWHVVLYTFMGLFPESVTGAQQLIRESARLAAATGTERLIVKTVAEAHRIPSIEENTAALRLAHDAAREQAGPASTPSADADSEIYHQAKVLVDEVRGLAPSLTQALPAAFERGLLDVPYCLHPDNRNRTRTVIGADGLQWSDTGAMPIPAGLGGGRIGSRRFLADLSFHRRRLDPAPQANFSSRAR